MRRRSFVTRVLLAALVLPLLCIAGCENSTPHTEPCTLTKVIAFTATWCGPCQRAHPFLARIETQGVEVQIVDIDQHPELARKYGVTSVPTFFVYVHGQTTVRTQDISVVVALTRFGR